METKRYSVKEAATILGVNPRTIQREINRGSFKANRVGNKFIITQEQLDGYLSQNKIVDTNELDKNLENFYKENESEILSLLQKLIRIPSESSNEEAITQYLKEFFDKHELRSTIYEKEGYASIKATYGYSKTGVLLDCPADTTPAGDLSKWSFLPFEGRIHKGRVYGRGAADAKAGMACMIFATLFLKKYFQEKDLRVELVFDGGEQDGKYIGMKEILTKGLDVDAGIIGYAGDQNDFSIGARGYHRFKINFHGEAVHTGSRYKSGVNAISNATKFISELEKENLSLGKKSKYFEFGNRVTVSQINGGRAINIVPDECELKIDFRVIPEVTKEMIQKHLNNILNKLSEDKEFKYNLEYITGAGAYLLENDEKIVSSLESSINKVYKKRISKRADGPAHIGNLLEKFEIPVVVWGPKGENVHSYNEYVEIDSLSKTIATYVFTILNFYSIK